jgi:prepilin-type N-terminal cleavage/methylation domain-containing protein
VRTQALPGRAGFSLIELLVSVTLLAVVLASAGLVSGTSRQLYTQSAKASALETRARQSLDRVVDELSAAALVTITPDPVGANWTDTLDFQQVTGVVGGAVALTPLRRMSLELEGGEGDDGLDNDGDGLVDECQLVLIRSPGAPDELRTVLARRVRRLAEGEVANVADDNGNGLDDESGFCLQRQGDVMRVFLTLEDFDGNGGRLTRSVSTSFRIRN